MEVIFMENSLQRELQRFSATQSTRVAELTSNIKALQLEGLIEVKAQVDVLTLRSFYNILLTPKGSATLDSLKN
jgi:hypothetical protein